METVNSPNSSDFQPVPKRKAAKRKMNTIDNEDASKMETETSCSAESARPIFPPIKKEKLANGIEIRKIPVPAHRYSPLKENWMKIFTPIVEHLHLQIRFNLKIRQVLPKIVELLLVLVNHFLYLQVEIRTCKETPDIASIQKAADFVRAFVYGFDIDDALALIRLDDLFIDSFEIKDVKSSLKGNYFHKFTFNKLY
jgi:RNA-binding protein PNO1